MAPLFALLAAAAWGTSDFAAGHASRRSSAVSVVILTHLAAVAVLVWFTIDLAPIWSEGLRLGALRWRGSPTLTDAGWGLGAGLGGGVGAMLLFRGLGRGSMAVVAPITAAGAATIPAVVGLASGESLSSGGRVGIMLALAAIVLISLTGTDDDEVDRAPDTSAADQAAVASGDLHVLARLIVVDAPPAPRGLGRVLAVPGVADALGSGVGFGLFFVCLSRASDVAGYWPLLTARSVSVVLFSMIAWRSSIPALPERGSRAAVVLAGVLDGVAALFYVLATRSGLLSVVAVLASLYPGMTVVLAWGVTKERIDRRQVLGLAVAAAAVGLLAI